MEIKKSEQQLYSNKQVGNARAKDSYEQMKAHLLTDLKEQKEKLKTD